MYIYPAIDLLNKNVVRLTNGEYQSAEILSKSPLAIAEKFYRAGARRLHIVDLDGAKNGTSENFDMIKSISNNFDMFIEVGGGIRNEDIIKRYIDVGVSRVILGTVAVRDFSFVEKCVKNFGDKIAVGIDCKNELVAISGWQEISTISGYDFAVKCRNAGVSTIIYTDIDTDGAMKGTNVEAFSKLKTIQGLNVIASGGVSFNREVYALRDLGVEGIILGKALYHNLLNLNEVLAISRGEK